MLLWACLVAPPTLPRGGGAFLWIFFVVAFCSFFGILQPVAFPIGFDDVDAVRDAVEQGASQALVAEYFGPVLEGQVGGEDDALAFVRTADDLEEQLGAGLGEGHVAKLVEDE